MRTIIVTTLSDLAEATDDAMSLRAAIAEAGRTSDDVTIVFAPALQGGAIQLTLGELLIARGLVIDGDIDDDGKPDVTIDARQSSRAIRIDDGDGATQAEVTLNGLIVTGGRAGAGNGGGILNQESLTLSDSVVEGNRATSGGGVFSGGALTVIGSRISGNAATYHGAGLRLAGRSTIIDSVIGGNEADEKGGGLRNSGVLEIVDSQFIGNRAGKTGGAIDHAADATSLTVTGGLIHDNDAVGVGDAINAEGPEARIEGAFVAGAAEGSVAGVLTGDFADTLVVDTLADGIDPNDGKLSLREALDLVNRGLFSGTIAFDAALKGGTLALTEGELRIARGVTLDGDVDQDGLPDVTIDAGGLSRVMLVSDLGFATRFEATLRGLTLVGGATAEHGGGINNAETLTLIDCEVAGNEAGFSGGGVYSTWGASLTLQGTTVRANSAGFDGGGVLSDGALVIERGTVADNHAGVDGGGLRSGGTARIVDTLFAGNDADRYGGAVEQAVFAQEMTISGGEIVGNDAAAGGDGLKVTGPSVALDGVRIVGNGGEGGSDVVGLVTGQGEVGASPTALVVTTDADVIDPNDGRLSLREAIAAVNAGFYPGPITFSPLMKGKTIVLSAELGELKITRAVTIDGDVDDDGRPDVTIDAANRSRGFLIDDGAEGMIPVTLNGLRIRRGKSEEAGGGVFSREDLTLRNCVIEKSAAETGGGIDSRGRLLIEGGAIRDNTSVKVAGGICIYLGELRVVGATVSGNRSGTEGGGIYVSRSTAEIVGSTLSNNSAGQDGGGIQISRSSAAIVDSTVAGNEIRYANHGGGGVGVWVAWGPVTITRSTITGNRSASTGGGLWIYSADVTMTDSIVTGNRVGANADNVTVVDQSVPTTLTGARNVIDVDPAVVFADIDPATGGGKLADNGGATQTAALNASVDNPALDAGGDLGADQRGKGVYDARGAGEARGDIGAFELQKSAGNMLVVTTLKDGIDPTDDKVSLREALEYVNSGRASGTITFDRSLAGQTIALAGSELVISRAVSIDGDIDGDGLPDVTLDGQGLSRVLRIDDGDGAGRIEVALNGLIIQNGAAGGGNGGAILNQEDLTLADSVLRGNRATSGGGVFSAGKLTLRGVAVSGNTAEYHGGGLRLSGEAEVTDSTLSGNVAVKGNGGAVRNSGALRIANSTLAGNEAKVDGGAIDHPTNAVSLELDHVTVTGNKADGAGDGVVARGDGTRIDNSILAGNGGAEGQNLVGEPGGDRNLVGGDPATIFAEIDAETGGGKLADNGGKTETAALNPTAENPALDAAGPSGASEVDQRGAAAFDGRDDGEAERDIGAYEAQSGHGRLMVTTLADVVDPNDGLVSLREAIALVNDGAASGTISFAEALRGGAIQLTGGQLAIRRGVTIDGDVDGDGRPDIALDAEGLSRVFDIDDGDEGATIDVALSGLILRNGEAHGADGGAVRSVESLTLRNSVVETSHARNGGGLFSSGGLVVEGASFRGNAADGHGGGLQAGGVTRLVDSVFAANGAGQDGGALRNAGAMDIVNASFAGNRAGGDGGAIAQADGATRLAIRHATVTGNRAEGAGDGLDAGGPGARIANSIVAGNGGEGGEQVAGAVEEEASLIGGDPATIFAEIDPETGGGRLADNGGATQTVALNDRADNLALDAATEADATAADQRGAAAFDAIPGRESEEGGQRDLGAYELRRDAAGLVVTTALDVVDPNDGLISLREALDFVNSGRLSGAISFDPSLRGQTIALTGGELKISRAVEILGDVDGDGLPDVTLDAQGLSRVFDIDDGDADATLAVTLDGLILRNGEAFAADGGAIRNAETLTLRNSVVENSHALNGGGVFSAGGLTVEASSIRGNRADGDGGGLQVAGEARLEASVFEGNLAGGDGGAVSNAGALEAANATFVGNQAGRDGGAIQQAEAATRLDLDHVTITGNKAGRMGGGVGIAATGTTIDDSIVAGNRAGAGANLGGGFDGDRNVLDADPAKIFAEVDPLTGGGRLADNGGPTRTVALNPDAGNPALDGAGDPGGTDARGQAAEDADGDEQAQRDIGAYELGASDLAPRHVDGMAGDQALSFAFVQGRGGYRIDFADGGSVEAPTAAPMVDMAFSALPGGKGLVWALTEDGAVEILAIDGAAEPDAEASISLTTAINDIYTTYAALAATEDGVVHLLDAQGHLYSFAPDGEMTTFLRGAEPIFTPDQIEARFPARLEILADGEVSLSQADGGQALVARGDALMDPAEREALYGVVRLANGAALMVADGVLDRREADGAWMRQPGHDIDDLSRSADGATALIGTDGVLAIDGAGVAIEVDFGLIRRHLIAAGQANGVTYALDNAGEVHFQGAVEGRAQVEGVDLVDLAALPDGLYGLTDLGRLVRIETPTQNGRNQTLAAVEVSQRTFLGLQVAPGGATLSLEEAVDGADARSVSYDPATQVFKARFASGGIAFVNSEGLQPAGIQVLPDGVAFTLHEGGLYRFDPATGEWSATTTDGLTRIKAGADGGLYALVGDNVIVALDAFGAPIASASVSADWESWKARAITTLGAITDFSVSADGEIRYLDQDGQLVRIDPTEDWVEAYYGSGDEAEAWTAPYAPGAVVSMGGTDVTVAMSAELASGLRMVVDAEGAAHLGRKDGQGGYDWERLAWPGEIAALTVGVDDVFLATVEEAGETRVLAFGAEWRELRAPSVVTLPDVEGGPLDPERFVVDVDGATWLLGDDGRLLRLGETAGDRAVFDIPGFVVVDLFLDDKGRLAMALDDGRVLTSNEDDFPENEAPLLVHALGTVGGFGAILMLGFGVPAVRGAYAGWNTPFSVSPVASTFDQDFALIGAKGGSTKIKSEIAFVKTKGKERLGSALKITGYDFGRMVGSRGRVHLGEGIFEPAGNRADQTGLKSEFRHIVEDLQQRPNHALAGAALAELQAVAAPVKAELLTSLGLLETAIADAPPTGGRRPNLLAIYGEIAQQLFGPEDPIAQRLTALVAAGKVISPENSDRYSAYLAQIGLDLNTIGKLATTVESDRAPEEKQDAIGIALELRGENPLQHTRVTGLPSLENNAAILESIGYFGDALRNKHHKVNLQLAELNIGDAEALKRKLATMQAGDSIEVASDWSRGVDLRLNGGYTFTTASGGEPFFGFTAALGYEWIERYSIKFTKTADGGVALEIGRDRLSATSLMADAYADPRYTETDGLQFAPEFDLTVELARKAGFRDGARVSLTADALASGVTTTLDDLFADSLDPSRLLARAVEGSGGGSHGDVASWTLDVSAEASLMPYGGLNEAEDHGDDPQVRDHAKGAFYMALPGLMVDLGVSLYDAQKNTSYDPGAPEKTREQAYRHTFDRIELTSGARAGATVRGGFGGEADSHTGDDSSPNVRVPIYGKAAIYGPTRELYSYNWLTDDLTPEHKNLLINTVSTTEAGVTARFVDSIAWTGKTARDHTLLELPAIQRLLAQDTSGALRADLVALVSYTSTANRTVIKNQVQVLKELFAGRETGADYTEEDRLRAAALIERLEDASDFVDGRPGDQGDKQKFAAALEELRLLAADGDFVGPFVTLDARLADDGLWQPTSRAGQKVTLSLEVPLDPDARIDLSDADSKAQIAQAATDHQWVRVTGISVADSVSSTSTGQYAFIAKATSTVSAKLTRPLAEIAIGYGADGELAYDPSRTVGRIYSGEAAEAGRETLAQPPLAGRRIPEIENFGDYVDAHVAAELKAYFPEYFAANGQVAARHRAAAEAFSDTLRTRRIRANWLVAAEGTLAFWKEDGTLARLDAASVAEILRKNPRLAGLIEGRHTGAVRLEQPLTESQLTRMAEGAPLTEADLPGMPMARETALDPLRIVEQLRGGMLTERQLTTMQWVVLGDMFDRTGQADQAAIRRALRNAVNFEGAYQTLAAERSYLVGNGLRDATTWFRADGVANAAAAGELAETAKTAQNFRDALGESLSTDGWATAGEGGPLSATVLDWRQLPADALQGGFLRAYLGMVASGDRAAFLDGFRRVGELRQALGQVGGELSAHDQALADRFIQSLAEVGRGAGWTDLGDDTLNGAILALGGLEADAARLVVVNGHEFAIARRTENGQVLYSFVDANAVEFVATDAEKLSNKAASYLNQQIGGRTLSAIYGIGVGGHVSVVGKVRSLDPAAAQGGEVEALRTLVRDFRDTGQILADRTVTVYGQTVSVGTFYEMGAMLDGERIHAALSEADALRVTYDPRLLVDYMIRQGHLTAADDASRHARMLLRRQLEGIADVSRLLGGGDQGQAVRLLEAIQGHVDLEGGIDPALRDAYLGQDLTVDRLPGMAARVDRVSSLIGMVQSVVAINNFMRRKRTGEAIDRQEKADVFITSIGLGVELGSGFLESGMAALGQRMMRGAWVATQRLGTFLARSSGAALGILMTGFDLYGIAMSTKRLKEVNEGDADDNTVDGVQYSDTEIAQMKQDARFAIGLSTVGAAIGIGVTAMAVLGGMAAAMTATGIGAALGAVLMAVGGIYSGVRAVQEIEKVIDLSTREKLKEGWRGFFGLSPSKETQDKLIAASLNEAAELLNADVRRMMEVGALELLARDSEDDGAGRMGGVVFTYSNGVEIERVHSKAVWVEVYRKDFPIINLSAFEAGRDLMTQDDIDAAVAEAEAYIAANFDADEEYGARVMITDDVEHYEVSGIQDANENYTYTSGTTTTAFTPDLTGYEDLDLSGLDLDGLTLSTPTYYTGWGQLMREDFDPEKDYILYTLGGGQDLVLSDPDTRSVFALFGAGYKLAIGGDRNDTFFLYNREDGQTDEPVGLFANTLEGGAGVDTLIVEGVREGGNLISLGALSRAADLEFWTVGIENVTGADGGRDLITGSDEANVIDGRGGADRISGGAGDDLISVHGGDTVYGGEGSDTFRILRKEGVAGDFILHETASEEDGSTLLLDFEIGMIGEARLVAASGGYDVEIDLEAEGGTQTLRLKGMFAPDLTRREINLTLITSDGFFLVPNFAQQIASPEDFDASFTVRYLPELDATLDADFAAEGLSFEVDAAANRVRKHGASTVEIALPDYMKLLAEGGGFDDTLTGGAGMDILRGYDGRDVMIGGGGGDLYTVQVDMEEVRDKSLSTFDFVVTDTGEKVIDNRAAKVVQLDENGAPMLDEKGEEIAVHEQDYLVYGVAREDIRLVADGDDIVLSYAPNPNRIARVRIKDFLLDEAHRHLTLIDGEGCSWVLGVDEAGNPGIFEGAMTGGEGDDRLTAARASVWLSGGLGDDRLAARSHRQDGERLGADTLDGGAGDDVLIDDAGDNAFLGGAGDDRIVLAAGDDYVSVGAGSDVVDLRKATGLKLIDAHAGRNDRTRIELPFDPEAEAVSVYRSGRNLVMHPAGEDPELVVMFLDYFVDPAQQRIELRHRGASWTPQTLLKWALFAQATEQDDMIQLQQRNFVEEEGALAFDAGGGHDTVIDVKKQGAGTVHVLRGGGGADRIFAGDGVDRVQGGAGDDELYGEAGDDALCGGDGFDLLVDFEGVNMLSGGAGDDTIHGQGTLRGGDGSDQLAGGDGADTLFAGDGAGDVNVLSGRGGADLLHGGDGEDRMNGGDGADRLFGGAGDDRLFASNGADAYYGGAGHDVFSMARLSGGVTADFAAMSFEGVGISRDAEGLVEFDGIEAAVGTDYADVLAAGGGVTTLNGGAGDDILISRRSATLDGGLGDDLFAVELGDGTAMTLREDGGEDALALGRSDGAGSGQDAPDQVWLRQVGDDLVVTLRPTETGATEDSWGQVTVEDYFADADARIESIRLNDGRRLVGANIDKLVDYMAGATPFDAGAGAGQGRTVADRIEALWTPVAASV